MKFSLCSVIVMCCLFVNPSFTIGLVDLTGIANLPLLRSLSLEGISNLIESLAKALRTVQPIVTGDVNRNYCKEQSCKKPEFVLPVTEYLVAKSLSPLYVSCLPRNDFTENMDNICYTFFQVNNLTRVLFCESIVYKDGTTKRFCFLDDDGPGLGTLRGANPSCTFQVFAVGTQCTDCFILYRCFLKGACQEIDTVKDPGYDQVFGVCASPYQSDSCKDATVDFIKSQPQYNVRPEFHKLPQKLPYQCVTCLPNNGVAINTGKMRENDKSCAADSTVESSSAPIDIKQFLAALQAGLPTSSVLA